MNPVRIGANAGRDVNAGVIRDGAIAIGADAGRTGAGMGIYGATINASPGTIAIGQRSTAGSDSIALGRDSRAEGHGNVTIGTNARSAGWSNITIGNNSDSPSTGSNILIAKSVRNTHSSTAVISPNDFSQPVSHANSQFVIGAPGISALGFSAWSNISDGRDKTDIQPLAYDPVTFIKGLQPKQYKYDIRQCYRHIEEITEEEFNALPEYEKQHRLITMPVFGLKLLGDDGEEGQLIPGFEWIEEYAYLGIRPKTEDPTCLENCYGDTPVRAMKLGDIPEFTTINQLTETIDDPRRPALKNTFYRDYFEALAAWKLSKCANPADRTGSRTATV